MFYLKLINKLIQDCGGLIDQFVDVLDGSRSTAVGVSGAGATLKIQYGLPQFISINHNITPAKRFDNRRPVPAMKTKRGEKSNGKNGDF